MLPAVSIFDSILASLGSITDVKRVKGYENDTNQISSEGFPPHSVTFVVEDGDEGQIAEMIYNKKTPGCYTNGTTDIEILSESGNVTHIRFYRPSYKNVYVKVNITKLAGYNDSAVDNIKNALVNYIKSADIHDTIYRQILMSVVIGQLTSTTSPEFSVTDVQISTDGTTYSQNDLALAFNESGDSSLDKIEVVVS